MERNILPRYQVIINDLISKIEARQYEPGELLPSENELSKLYEVSVPTVRKALGELVYRNVIFRIKGKGTYVQIDQPLEFSQKLESVKGKLICFVMLVDRYDDSMMKMITGAQKYLFSKQCSMNILCGSELDKTEQQLVQNCVDNKVDGAIWFSNAPEENLEGLRTLAKHGIPVVMLDRGPDQMPFTLISCYNLDGGYLMAKHLLDHGHERIAFASDVSKLPAERDRFKGYRIALEEYGIKFREKLFFDDCMADMEELVKSIQKEKITAVQCVHDKMAAKLVRRLISEGYNVPGDISVAGFDDSVESEYSFPKITSIYQPFEDMGAEAARQLLKRIGKTCSHCQFFLPVQLVVKESTGPVKRS